MKKRVLAYILIFLLFPNLAVSQELNNLRCHDIVISNDSIILDTLSIIPGSLIISDTKENQISIQKYNFDPARSLLQFTDTSGFSNIILTACYRVFPYDFSKTYSHKGKYLLVPDGSGSYNPFHFRSQNKQEDIFEYDGLNKSGSISRGINFGNNQDVVVNSNLNLQLSGKLSKEVDIVAAITDNNMPIQPYGNTQQIQEFDKVFIQLSMKNSMLTAGDFELIQPESYFMKYYKKVQGGDFKTRFNLKSNRDKGYEQMMSVHAAGALSKGKFARNNIQGVEGNQGPYRLKGNENELYIIVLAGTEKVYIDGRLLTRGQENDYIIDYNTAEIIFTPKALITKDKRITVEFEYSDKNYARSLFFAGTNYTLEKGNNKQNRLNIGFNFFSQQDIKNQNLQQDLTADQKYLLSQIGDSIDKAFVKRIDSVGYNKDEILYMIKDTLVNSQYFDSIFVYPETPDSNAVYRVGFTLVGDNKGNYIQENNTVNGRVYKWVAPVDSIPQGNYEPISLLITPRKTQMVNISAEYTIADKTKLMIEFALSNKDINTFSKIDKNDDKGYGLKTRLEHSFDLSKVGDSINQWSLTTAIDYEWTSKYFNPIEPFRNVEFNRDWNQQSNEYESDDHISAITLYLKNPKSGFANYGFQLFNSGKNYNAIKNIITTAWSYKGFKLNFDGSILSTNDTERNTQFIRSNVILSKNIKNLVIGIKNEQEHNTFKSLDYDTLIPNSYSFNDFEVFLSNPDTMKNRYRGFYRQRLDKLADGNSLKKSTLAEEAGFSMNFMQKANNRININGTYRKLKILNDSLSGQKADNNVVSRIEYISKIKKGFIRFNVYYEIGSGQELKQEFSYIKVADGEGIYTWTDYNQDGIQQLNEFEVAKFKDQANYIRIYLPGNDYIKTYSNQFSSGVNITPAAFIKQRTELLKQIAKLSNQTVFQIEHKTTSDEASIRFNPFISESKIADTLLVSMSSSLRNTLSFNKYNPKFGIDLNYQNNRSKQLLVNGFETRLLKSFNTLVRWKIRKKVTLFGEYTKSTNLNDNEFFDDRDYNIIVHDLQPKVSIQPNNSLIIDLLYNFTIKTNELKIISDSTVNEQSYNHKFGLMINYKVVNKGNLQISVDFLNIRYNADVNTSLAYEMLDGFRKGNNATWSIGYQRNLAKYLQLNIVYDGRKSPDIKTIHIGSVQLRAYF